MLFSYLKTNNLIFLNTVGWNGHWVGDQWSSDNALALKHGEPSSIHKHAKLYVSY